MVGDLVTHNLHDVVTIGNETERQGGRENSKLPNWHWRFGCGGRARIPCSVDDSPGADSVTNIVGTVSEGGSAGGENLDERVGVLDLVGVLGSMAINTLHTLALRSTVNTSLGGVDIVVDTVESTDNDHGRDALEGDDHVVLLVDLTALNLVLVEVAHCPAERTALVTELSVETLLTLSDKLLVAELAVLGNDSALLSVLNNTVVRVRDGFRLKLLIVLNDGIVGD